MIKSKNKSNSKPLPLTPMAGNGCWSRSWDIAPIGAARGRKSASAPKMLRIDVPKVVTFERADPGGPAVRLDPPRIEWITHYYGGASIFSFTLTDEATVMAKNKPYERPSYLTFSPYENDAPVDQVSGREEDDLDNDEGA